MKHYSNTVFSNTEPIVMALKTFPYAFANFDVNTITVYIFQSKVATFLSENSIEWEFLERRDYIRAQLKIFITVSSKRYTAPLKSIVNTLLMIFKRFDAKSLANDCFRLNDS